MNYSDEEVEKGAIALFCAVQGGWRTLTPRQHIRAKEDWYTMEAVSQETWRIGVRAVLNAISE